MEKMGWTLVNDDSINSDKIIDAYHVVVENLNKTLKKEVRKKKASRGMGDVASTEKIGPRGDTAPKALVDVAGSDTCTDIVLTPTPLQIGPSKKEVEGWCKGSGSSHLDVSKYYPFGMEGIYISVQNCFQAPPEYVYRPMVIEHVRNLFKEFIMNPKDCSTKADLMPFDPKTNMPLTSVDKANVHSYSYWVLSGQHSIEAAKYVQVYPNPSVRDIISVYAKRTSRIDLNCPKHICQLISKNANEELPRIMKNAPYPQLIKQLRNQWIAFGCPDRPKTGVAKGHTSRKQWDVSNS